MEDKNHIELKININKDIYSKLNKIVDYFNMREEIINSDRKDEKISIEDIICGSVLREIERIETFNHKIIYDGDKSLGDKSLVLKNRIKEIIKEKNMKQLDLCKLTNIDRSNLSMIMNNHNQPSVDHLLRIWVALDFYPLEQMFYRE